MTTTIGPASGHAGLPAAALPAPGVDARVSLAATLQSSRTTAVLLGSGISSSAGILTGWEVTLDLIRQIASLEGVPQEDLGDRPDVWWMAQGRGEPRYDTLLATLAPTDADRQSRLRRYFDPTGPDGAVVPPTPAHRALAKLAARGSVPVILTTNFDRLTERALIEEGLDPQVIIDPSGVRGMTPLRHADMTLVKLHGDYAGGRLRNSPDELDPYPRPWTALLREIFDQYGLLVVGWSAEYDRALARALAASVGRRYAWYWAAYQGLLTEEARRLMASHGAHRIDTRGADELLTDLVDRVQTLDRIAARGRKARRTNYALAPWSIRPPGWSVQPLIVLRAAAVLQRVAADETGDFGPEMRERLVDALEGCRLTTALRQFAAARHPVYATSIHTVGSAAPDEWSFLPGWHPPEGLYQNTINAVYRLGRDGTAGIGAIVAVRGPGQHGSEHSLNVTLDLGISVSGGLEVEDTAPLLRDALHAAGVTVIDALDELLPADATLHRLELHWDVPTIDINSNRPVPPAVGLRFSVFGKPTREHSLQAGYAEVVNGPLTWQAANDTVLRAMRKIALDSGYLDPRPGLEQMRRSLGDHAGGSTVRGQ